MSSTWNRSNQRNSVLLSDLDIQINPFLSSTQWFPSKHLPALKRMNFNQKWNYSIKVSSADYKTTVRRYYLFWCSLIWRAWSFVSRMTLLIRLPLGDTFSHLYSTLKMTCRLDKKYLSWIRNDRENKSMLISQLVQSKTTCAKKCVS